MSQIDQQLTTIHVCKHCRTMRGYFAKISQNQPMIFIKRQDIKHCDICNCCVEYQSHHCDVLKLCICSKNFKFLILLLFYSAFMFISGIASNIVLNLHWQDEDILGLYSSQSMATIILFALFTLVSIGLLIIFLGDSPLSQPKEFEHAITQLEHEMPEGTPFKRFCSKYFGSPKNCCKWLTPI